MARRIPLPRLTQRQRMARWQRERRQQAVIVTGFTAVLLFVLGLAAWAASDRYYERNLTPAALVDGRVLPQREFQRQLQFQLLRFYHEYGVPPGFENDPQLAQDKAFYEPVALDRAIEQRILDRAARRSGIALTRAQVDEQYAIEFGEFKVRHILFSVDAEAEDKDLADATARAKARAVANQLRAAPLDQDLWNRLAAEHSDDPGSKFSGGELGTATTGRYVAEFEEAIRTHAVGQISDPIRTDFGYHLIQVMEQHDPSTNDLVERYLTSGFSVDDLKAEARYEWLRKELERRARADSVTSPTEQVHLARIVVNMPRPTLQGFQDFTAALQKQTDVRQALEAGTDFAEIAKQHSDDTASSEQGGDVGWFARGMLTDPTAEDRVFSAEPGQTTEPVNIGQQWIVYRVLEKEVARELTDDQSQQIRRSAYQHWLQRQMRELNVLRYGVLF